MVIKKYKHMIQHFNDPKPETKTPICGHACKKGSIESLVKSDRDSKSRSESRAGTPATPRTPVSRFSRGLTTRNALEKLDVTRIGKF